MKPTPTLAEDKARQKKNFIAVLKEFSEDKNKLIRLEMRDGDQRGFTWLKLRSIPAVFRTIGGLFKTGKHSDAQRLRLEALTYANYLQHRMEALVGIKDPEKHSAEVRVIRHEMSCQYEYFKAVAPKSRYTNMLKNALGSNYIPSSFDNKNQKDFYLLWPLYVTGKHEANYLQKNVFNADNAFKVYLNNNPEAVLTERLFKEIFTTLKESIQPKRQTIIENGIANNINLDEVVKECQLDGGRKLSSIYRWSDTQMGMALDPRQMAKFTVSAISENGHVYGQPSADGSLKQLKDGWYQYVILAENGDNAKKHDMRYFPCVSKSGQQTVVGGPPPYKKYVAHSEISGGLSLYAGGAFRIENSVIVELDDASGHYEMKDAQQKQQSLHYAKQKLCQLGLSQERADNIDIRIMPEMTTSAKHQKYQKKISAAMFGFFSPDVPGLSTACERRPHLPKKLRVLERNLRAPNEEMIEQSFESKIQFCR